jgi:O-antigen ligase
MNPRSAHRRSAVTTLRPAGVDGLLAAASTTAYVASAIKYMNRDPLSTETGVQALVEIGLVAMALILAAIPVIRRRRFPRPTPPALCFSIFAGLAMLSSVFSYWPTLSLIKGGMLLAILLIAILLCAERPPSDILRYFYWASWSLIVIGTCLKFSSHQPLFDIDEYSGRARFSLFALHWGSLADLSALTLLIGRLLPRRPHWSCQLFLFCINLATCARASTASLILVLVLLSVWTFKANTKTISAIAFAAAGAVVIVWIALTVQLPVSRIPFESFYGDKVTVDEITSLNGRTGVWVESEGLIPGTLVFGYGVEGARAAILREFEWAGHAHNAYLEILFAGGLPGLVMFLIGWGAAIVQTARTSTIDRPVAIGIYVYMFICGCTDPNLTLLQFLPMFLIVCIDASARAELAPGLAVTAMRGPGMLVGTSRALIRAHA